MGAAMQVVAAAAAAAAAAADWHGTVEPCILAMSAAELAALDLDVVPLLSARPLCYHSDAVPDKRGLEQKRDRAELKASNHRTKVAQAQRVLQALEQNVQQHTDARTLHDLRAGVLQRLQRRFDSRCGARMQQQRDAMQRGKCAVCFEKHADMVFVGCGHQAMCQTCTSSPHWARGAAAAADDEGPCPICRGTSKFILLRPVS
jgi:hypothetical protein